jgi:hypothetical protein
MHYAPVHPPSRCYASANRMHATTKARAEPIMRMPPGPPKWCARLMRECWLSRTTSHHSGLG